MGEELWPQLKLGRLNVEAEPDLLVLHVPLGGRDGGQQLLDVGSHVWKRERCDRVSRLWGTAGGVYHSEGGALGWNSGSEPLSDRVRGLLQKLVHLRW